MESKPKWLEAAEKEIGVKEVKGGENPRIIAYHACTTLRALEDEVPWCSAFANWCMKQAGVMGTRLANARSWLTWGVELKEPKYGCIVVFKRGAPPSGHVGFYICNVAEDYVKVLGGNQSDQVKYSNFLKEDVLGYRWPKEVVA